MAALAPMAQRPSVITTVIASLWCRASERSQTFQIAKENNSV